MTARKYMRDFLSKRSARDAEKAVKGELRELSTSLATYFYGNNEVNVSPVDEKEEPFTLYVDNYGNGPILVEG